MIATIDLPRVGGFALSERAELEYWFHLAKQYPAAIRMDKGEPDLPPPAPVIETAVRAIQANQVKYSSGLPQLKHAIAARLHTKLGVEFEPDTEICITHGAMGGLNACLEAIDARGGEVAIQDVAWPTFRLLIENAGATVSTYPFFAEESDEPVTTDRLRAILINSPHNPTGLVISPCRLQELVAMAEESGAWIISDETYEALIFNGHSHVSSVSLPAARERTLLVGSFSKTYCMTGWRVGYVAGPAHMIKRVAQVSHLATGGINRVAQEAAVAALDTPDAELQKLVDIYQRRGNLAIEMLDESPCLRPLRPEGTFYLFVNVERCTRDSRAFARRLLERYEVAAVPGAVFGIPGEGYLRFSLTVDEKQLGEAMNRLRDCAASFL
jgi:aspartate/methionine/tyrosine aminotransferase